MIVYLLGSKKGNTWELRGAVREKGIALNWDAQRDTSIFELDIDPGLSGIDFRLKQWSL